MLCGIKNLAATYSEEGICTKAKNYCITVLQFCEILGIQNCISAYLNDIFHLWMFTPSVNIIDEMILTTFSITKEKSS